MDSQDLTGLLHSTFGFPAFRVNQEAVCRAATEGQDVLLVMPTGAGKSLCYQLPAIARGGTALVISPLIALMEDQAAKLTAAGLRVARIHSGMDREQSRQASRDYLDGKLQFLFIAPERMRVPGFPEMLAKRKLALIAIDEAHCISAWGHDFRPDYRTLGDHLPALRPAPIIALTATATPTVQNDIVAQLHLANPSLFIHGFRRTNLAIEIVEMSKPQRNAFTVKLLKSPENRPAIVYAPSRKSAEELASLLGGAAAYHAGLEPAVRERVQRNFLAGKVDVVVATIAFGMGIDKADVRTVVHTAMPASVEAFYQEIGRAGRDGLQSRSVLLHSFADRKMHEFFLDRDYPAATEISRVVTALTGDFQMPEILCQRLRMDRLTLEKAIEKLVAQGGATVDMAGNVRRLDGATGSNWRSGYEAQIAFRRSQIDRMAAFTETQQCRMAALINHFGDTADGRRPCGKCDFCAPEQATAQAFAAPTAAQERDLRSILRALESAPSKATGRLHTDLALGVDRKDFDGLLDALTRAGLIILTSETFTNAEGKVLPYKKACLTHEGRTRDSSEPLGVLLRASDQASLGKATGSKSRSTKKMAAQHAVSYTPDQARLDDSLRAWRKAEAAKTGKPAFIVLSDAVIRSITLARPQNVAELRSISGIGPDKADKFGAAILALCRESNAPPGPAPKTLFNVENASEKPRAPESDPISAGSLVAPPQIRREPAQSTFSRPPKVSVPDSAPSLTADQQALDQRLRDWRKAEAERIGLPQFFVLGSSTLRSIVLLRPSSLAQLHAISGLEPDKADRFGPGILEVCNPEAATDEAR